MVCLVPHLLRHPLRTSSLPLDFVYFLFSLSHSSIHSQYTSIGWVRWWISVWNFANHILHCIEASPSSLLNFTSTVLLSLQKGQSNTVSTFGFSAFLSIFLDFFLVIFIIIIFINFVFLYNIKILTSNIIN